MHRHEKGLCGEAACCSPENDTLLDLGVSQGFAEETGNSARPLVALGGLGSSIGYPEPPKGRWTLYSASLLRGMTALCVPVLRSNCISERSLCVSLPNVCYAGHTFLLELDALIDVV